MQNNIQQRTVNLQTSVVFDESELAEPVHEETDPGSGRANDLRKRLLAHLRNHFLRYAFLPEVGQQQENPGQSLLAGIEQLINQILPPQP